MDIWNAREAEGLITCVGLDPNQEKMPPHLLIDPSNPHMNRMGVRNFLIQIIDATHALTGTYKLNFAFYLYFADLLYELVRYINTVAPGVAVILDPKWADIGSTNEHYAKFAFDYLGVDAITVHAWHGAIAMQPFLNRANKGVFVVCRTSNEGSEELQMRTDMISTHWWFQQVALNVQHTWNRHGNCGLVVGGTCATPEIRAIRRMRNDLPFLMPGFGTQGGDLEAALTAGFTPDRRGVLAVSASGIIHTSREHDFAAAACAKLVEFNNAIARIRAAK